MTEQWLIIRRTARGEHGACIGQRPSESIFVPLDGGRCRWYRFVAEVPASAFADAESVFPACFDAFGGHTALFAARNGGARHCAGILLYEEELS